MPPGPVSCIGGTKYPHCIVLYCIVKAQFSVVVIACGSNDLCLYQYGTYIHNSKHATYAISILSDIKLRDLFFFD